MNVLSGLERPFVRPAYVDEAVTGVSAPWTVSCNVFLTLWCHKRCMVPVEGKDLCVFPFLLRL